jgi:hypothetical protein
MLPENGIGGSRDVPSGGKGSSLPFAMEENTEGGLMSLSHCFHSEAKGYQERRMAAEAIQRRHGFRSPT